MNTVCVPLICIFFNFFLQCLIIFQAQVFCILGQVYSQVFQSFCSNCECDCFSISLSLSSLLACKNATDFWILILYPATLLNSFISYSSFFVEYFGYSMYSIMSSANKDSSTMNLSFLLLYIQNISCCFLFIVAYKSHFQNYDFLSGLKGPIQSMTTLYLGYCFSPKSQISYTGTIGKLMWTPACGVRVLWM